MPDRSDCQQSPYFPKGDRGFVMQQIQIKKEEGNPQAITNLLMF